MNTFEFPDEAGYPDGAGTLDQTQTALIGEVGEHADPDGPFSDLDFYVVDDDKEHTYFATVADTEIGYMTYEVKSEKRVELLATVVFPEFRGQGVASEFIRRVLGLLRDQGKTITIMCPVVRVFIDAHPQFADIVDPRRPGILRVRPARA